MSELDQLVERVGESDTAALARAISLVGASSELADQIHERVRKTAGNARVIGVTGAPGVGKSTLVNCLIDAWRKRGQRVAVLAVDPSSPISGGAVLGDRTRMGQHGEDADVFIRSLASRGHLGGLSTDILCIIDLIDYAGWDVVLLETVGTGQSETEVAQIADINLVVNAPGMGDEVQAIKAGILEIADVLVINKADQPLAGRTEAQLKSMLELRESSRQQVPVVKTVATRAEGIEDVIEAVTSISNTSEGCRSESRYEDRARRLLAEQLAEQVRALVLSGADPEPIEAVLKTLH